MAVQTALLVANIALVVITGIYAALTYSVARSGRRSAEASQEAADAAQTAATASQEALALQRAAVTMASHTQAFSFNMGPAGPFEGGFGFALLTDGNSYLVHAVTLENLTFAASGDEPGLTFGLGTALSPVREVLPYQLDGPDHLLFEVDANSLAAQRFPESDWHIKWWDCIVSCSLSHDDPAIRRVVVRSPGHPRDRH